jgi:OOP family OmpA-OmpF porin
VDQCPGTAAGIAVNDDGCPVDKDGDGVYDSMDQCPGTAAGIAVNDNGCPADKDGDGVADYRDSCPDTRLYVQVDDKGCPVDRDGDGVADYLDNCPNTRSGADVDASGCPLDSDGDGIANYLDKCPDTPKGSTVDYSGCDYFRTVASATVTSKGTWVFNDIQFDTGSDVINQDSFDTLNKIADQLIQNPQLKLEIQGHTDNTGSSSFNTALSKKRAQAVEKYFLSKGVPSEQIRSVGFGPSMPIASNDTPAGRASNRRVEFKPVQ